jgi:hypothetical protein
MLGSLSFRSRQPEEVVHRDDERSGKLKRKPDRRLVASFFNGEDRLSGDSHGTREILLGPTAARARLTQPVLQAHRDLLLSRIFYILSMLAHDVKVT